jgi:hypothetical protein
MSERGDSLFLLGSRSACPHLIPQRPRLPTGRQPSPSRLHCGQGPACWPKLAFRAGDPSDESLAGARIVVPYPFERGLGVGEDQILAGSNWFASGDHNPE